MDMPIAAPAAYHFIGVGGIGMSALAYILAKQGCQVSGSDLTHNACTQRLCDLGVTIHQGHAAANLPTEPAQVIYSSAIQETNPELAAARTHHLPIFHRAELLAHLVNGRPSIGVAGTHGKTTTSSMIAYLLLAGGLDPTVLVGGEVEAWAGNARVGDGHYLVAEVDESDGSLVHLRPTLGVVTNIELDHPDHYTNLEAVVAVFQQYASQSDVVVASLDCPNVAKHLRVDLGYTLMDAPGAAYAAREIAYWAGGTTAAIWERGTYLGELELSVLGAHNLSNALAAVAVGRYVGLEFGAIASALRTFKGARRRFELRGTVADVVFVDDYAHHPSEVAATLAAAHLQKRRVVAIFQPHRYSRITSLFSEFATAFSQADVIGIVPTYAAGEPLPTDEREQQLAKILAQTLAAQTAEDRLVFYEPQLQNLPQRLVSLLQPGDLVLFLGAGNLNQLIPAVMEAYETQVNCPEAVTL